MTLHITSPIGNDVAYNLVNRRTPSIGNDFVMLHLLNRRSSSIGDREADWTGRAGRTDGANWTDWIGVD
jgi:hypothetical protein